jgi:hypothetical protein
MQRLCFKLALANVGSISKKATEKILKNEDKK